MKHLKLLLKLVLFVLGLYLVVMGQKTIGYPQLAQMGLGLAMLLYLIYSYNKKYNN